MALVLPTLQSLVQQARNSFRAEAPGTDAWLWPSNIYVVAKVLGGLLSLLFMRIGWINKQRFVSTCTDMSVLLLHAAQYGLSRKPASYAQGFVDVPAVYPFTVPAGTVFKRDDGLHYVTSTDASLAQFSPTGTIVVGVVCQTVGKIGNTLALTPLTTSLTATDGSPLSPVVDPAGIGQGADIETFQQLQTRVLNRLRNPPMGGSQYDYETWATSLPGVTRAFATGNAYGAGTVGVLAFMDGTYANGIPQPNDIAAVQSYLDAMKPATANVFVAAGVCSLIDIVVGRIVPDSAANRLAVVGELQAVFANMTKPSTVNSQFVLRKSWLEQAVSNATGIQYDEGLVSPSVDMTFAVGEIPCIGNITFTT